MVAVLLLIGLAYAVLFVICVVAELVHPAGEPEDG